MRTHLLVIDPQNDFCDPDHGSLYVPGAQADMARLAAFIDHAGADIDAIHVTLDSHHPVDIAHPIFWRDAAGEAPAPFTGISPDAVRAGKWTTRRPEDRDRALAYLDALAAGGRYPHTIWPPHCLIGSRGHNVEPTLFAALCRWEASKHAVVDYVMKGTNPWTEHFSAIRAEVIDPNDPSTQPNTRLIAALKGADRVLIAGEAGSHCVANTVRDLANELGERGRIEKLVLLEDTISPVPGFEGLQHAFVADLTARGMALSSTAKAAG